MPDSEQIREAAAPPRPGQEVAQPSRRSVLRGAAGAGAAGLAIGTLAGTALAAPALAASRERHQPAEPVGDGSAQEGEAVVVHVRDVRSGEMDFFRGTSHVKVTDRALAARLSRASR